MKTSNAAIALLLVLSLGGWGYYWWARQQMPTTPPPSASSHPAASTSAARVTSAPPRVVSATSADSLTDDLSRELRSRLERMLAHPAALPDETLLSFKSEADYRAFLERSGRAGLHVVSRLDGLRSARVRFDSIDSLERELRAHPDAYREIAANHRIELPPQPALDARGNALLVPFDNTALAFIGAVADRTHWGRGVTIAILDSGVFADEPSLAHRVRHLDLGDGLLRVQSRAGHGTAVATLAAGASADAPGVAPAASILSIRVTNTEGVSDSFTVARAIMAAADAGAQVINISLGGYATSSHLGEAIAYANDRGSVIVAAAGNDQADRLIWPAASPDVISVGAVDALGQLATFSNSGAGLSLTAPGYGVQAGWIDQGRTLFSGTSAAAPIVAGAIATLLSLEPGLSPAEAAAILTDHANDAGPPGADPHFGRGTLNLGWALNRRDTTRRDAAIAAQFFDPATEHVTVTVQNRGAVPLVNLTLNVSVAGTPRSHAIPHLAAGAVTTVRVPVDPRAHESTGTFTVQSALLLPHGVSDSDPANNTRATVHLSE